MNAPRQPAQHSSDATAVHVPLALLELLEGINNWYQMQLRKHPGRESAVTYLKSRGLSGEIARDFGLGYAPAGWSNLLEAFGINEVEKRKLLDTGMLIENPDNKRNPLYDRFRDRIMYPIRDQRGRVIVAGWRLRFRFI